MENKKNNNKWRRLRKYFLYTLFLFLLFISLLIVFLSYNSNFRQYIISQVVRLVNTQLLATLEVKDVHLLGVGGIKFDEVKLITQTDTLAIVNSIIIDVSLKTLLSNRIIVNKIVLNEPIIKLLRRKSDSTWNYERIAEPSLDTSHSQTNLFVKIKNFNFKNGQFSYIDSIHNINNGKKFNLSAIELRDLNITSNFNIDLKNNSFQSKIKSLTFEEINSDIKLNNLSGSFNIDTSNIKLEKVLLNTNYFNSNLQCFISNYNAFDENSKFDKAILNIDLYVSNYKNEFTNLFTNLPIELLGNYDIQLNANGKIDNLTINECNILTKNIEIYINGSIKEIFSNPSINLNVYDSKLDKASLKELLPKISKSLPDFNKISLQSIKANFKENDLQASIHIKVDEGIIDGNVFLDFKEIIKYKLNLETKNLRLKSVIPESPFKGQINSSILLLGEGTDLSNLAAQLDIKSNSSTISDISYEKLLLSAKFNKNKILEINNISLELSKDSSEKFIKLNGLVDLKNIHKPKYSIDGQVNNLNLNNFFKNNSFPDLLSGKIKIQGENINFDEIYAKADLRIDKIRNKGFSQNSLNLYININFIDNLKSLNLQSNFANMQIKGYFQPTKLLNQFEKQFTLIYSKINQDIIEPLKFYKNNDTTLKTTYKLDIDKEYFDLSLKFYDLAVLNLFIDGLEFHGSLNTKMNYLSDVKDIYLSLDTFELSSFHLKIRENHISIPNTNINFVYNISIDSVHNPELSYIDVELISKDSLTFNKNIIYIPQMEIFYSNKFLKYSANLDYNNIYIKNTGSLDFTKNIVHLLSDTLKIKYFNYEWSNTNRINISLNENFINIDNFEIFRNGSEKINLTGSIIDNNANNLNLLVSNIDFSEIGKILRLSHELQVSGNGSLYVNLNGNLANPVYNVETKINDLIINEHLNGDLLAILEGKNGIFTGSANLLDKSNKKIIEIIVKHLPLYLGLDSTRKIFDKNELFEINIFTKNFPLEIISKFVPNLNQLQGLVDLNARLYGFLPDNINYTGNFELNNGYFILENTNIAYRAKGNVSFSNNLINIEKLYLSNLNRDLRDGKAEITGFLKLNKTGVDYFDFKLQSDKFLVLSDASKKSLPDIYGAFVVGTEDSYLRFFGNLKEPNIEGDVVILNADLKMPQTLSRQVVKSNFSYEIKNNVKKYTYTTTIDSISNEKTEEIDFAELINYDLRIKIKNFSLLFDMGAIGEVHAKIGTKDPSVPIRYAKNRFEPAPKLYSGELELKEGSTVKIFRTMETKGFISFPTGSIENPTLDLQARYDGNYTDKNTTNYFTVFVYITGTKNEPKIKLEYLINGNPPVGDPKKIEEDAFILLATGRPRGVQSSGNALNASNLFDESINMGISQLASKSLTDLLLTTGVIQSADVKFEGEGMETAKVNFSGTIFGIGNWTIGGNIYDLSNLEISFEVPISVNSKAFNDIIFQISRSTNSTIINQLQDQKDFEMKIKLGGSW